MGTEADKVEIRGFDAYFDRGSGEKNLGKIILTNCTFEKELHDIMSSKTNRRIDIKEWIKDILVELELADFTWQNVQEEFGIAVSNVSAGTQDVTNETGTFPAAEKEWLSLGHGQGNESPISAVSVALTTTTATSTLTQGSDYSVDYDGARVCVFSGAGYAGDNFLANYTYTTVDAKKFKLGTSACDTQGVLRLEHAMQNGKVLTIKLYKAFIAADMTHTGNAEELSSHTLQFRTIQDDAHTNEELGYVEITV